MNLQDKNNEIATWNPVLMSMKGEDDVALAFFTMGKNEDTLFDFVCTPTRVDGCGLCFCLQGEGEFILDDKSYIIKKNDMCVVFPKTILQVIGRTQDFIGTAIATNTDFIRGLRVPASMNIYIFLKEHPCISLTQEQVNMFLKLVDILREKNSKVSHPYRKEMVESLLLTICYEIAGIYQEHKPLEKHIHSRQALLFRKFVALLYMTESQNRVVSYYADKLCVTPKYLSMVVKHCSGRAANWITRMTVLNAKSLLTNTNMTIQQISDKLNFPNPSFFGQYFKKNVGMTPKEYRNSK